MTDKPTVERDFSDSFIWRVQLRADRKHSWQQHARVGTLMREVLGLLDKWASNDPQRFVPAGLAAILKYCNKGKRSEGRSYTLRHLKFVMAELRARHIISPYFTMWDGRYGFVMEPHELRTCLLDDGKVCEKRAPKRFECSAEDAEKLTGCSPTCSPQSSPPVHHLFTDLFTTCSPTCSPTGSQKFTEQFTEQFTSELSKVYKNAELTEALCQSWLADGEQVGAPIRCSRLAVGTVEPKSRLSVLAASEQQEQKQEPPQSQKQEQVFFSSSSRPTDKIKTATIVPDVIPASASPTVVVERTKTIGDHFERGIDFDRLTDGRITEEDMTNFDEPDLRQCMKAAVVERTDQPFCGLITLATLMGVVMSQMKKRHKKNCPPMWLPVMKSMRAKAETERSTELNPNFRAVKGIKNLEPSAYHIQNSMERCEDEIWRTPNDRADLGYTVRTEYQAVGGKTYALWKKQP